MSQLIKKQTCPHSIGAVIEFSINVNPNSLWLNTTWIRFAEGQTTVGYKNLDAEFGSVGASGGSKKHQLTVNQLPKHRFKLFADSSSIDAAVTDKKIAVYGGETTNNLYNYNMKASDTEATLGQSSEVGNDEQFSILQPYIVVNKWERTA